MALPTSSKIGLAVVVAGALSYLVLSDTGEGVLEYMYVEQLMQTPAKYEGRTIKVHGNVVEGSVKQKRDSTGDYVFAVTHGGETLQVHYTNLLPDTFAEGGEVILTGQFDPAAGDGGRFESDEMSAKCPSKYETAEKVRDPSKPGQS